MCMTLNFITASDDVRTDDPAGLQNLIEGLFLGIQQKMNDLYRVTGTLLCSGFCTIHVCLKKKIYVHFAMYINRCQLA